MFAGNEPHPPIDIFCHGDEVVATVRGELDCSTAPGLAERLGEVIEIVRPRRLILDLAGVPFLDCAGARAIARVQARMDTGGQVVLRSLQPVPGKVIKITGLAAGCVIEGAGQGGHARVFGWPRWADPRRRRAAPEPGLRQIG